MSEYWSSAERECIRRRESGSGCNECPNARTVHVPAKYTNVQINPYDINPYPDEESFEDEPARTYKECIIREKPRWEPNY